MTCPTEVCLSTNLRKIFVPTKFWQIKSSHYNMYVCGGRGQKPWLTLRIYGSITDTLPHLLPKCSHNFTYSFREGWSWSTVVTYLRPVSGLHANTLSLYVYWPKRQNRQPIWNYATRTLTFWKRCKTRSLFPTQLRGGAHPWKLYNNKNIGELQQWLSFQMNCD